MPEQINDPRFVAKVIEELDGLIAVTNLPLPEDERTRGWDEQGWISMLEMLTRWRERIISRGFLDSTDTGWQTRALFDFDHVDTGYGVALEFVILGNKISDTLQEHA